VDCRKRGAGVIAILFILGIVIVASVALAICALVRHD
jgi:hypothetical protein